MADELKFDIELVDHVSDPAHKAAAALDELSNALKQAGGHSQASGEKIQTIKDPAEIARHALEGLSAGLKGMASALAGGDAKGAIEGATEALAGLAGLLDLVVPGLGQAAAAVVKLGGAFAGLVASGVEAAVEVTAFNAQLESTFDAFGKGEGAGERTIDMLDDVARTVPQSRTELAKWTREIEKMGVTDLGQVRNELLATASAQALLGEGGAEAFEKVSRKVNDAIQGHHALKIASKELTKTIGTNLASEVAGKLGMSLEKLEGGLKAGTVDAAQFGHALEETLIEKGAGPLDKMWMKSGAVTKKIKESFGELFSGVDTTPLTDAMRNVLALFDQTAPSGQAMKGAITDSFNGIIKSIGNAITEGEVWFLSMEVWALSMRLVLKPLIDTIHQIADAVDVAGKAAGLIEKPRIGPAPPPKPKTVSEEKVGAVTDTLDAANSALKWIQAINPLALVANALGKAIGNGLTNGLNSTTGEVDAAGHALGERGAMAVKEGAQVKSPSKLTQYVGAMMNEGLAVGMVSSDAPQRAARQMTGSALGGMVGSALTSPAANKNGGGAGITLSGLTIYIQAPHGVTDAAGLSASGLVLALEKLQLASGR